MTDRIAEVMRRHVSAQTESWETKLRCECGRGDFTSKLEYAVHVAEQITEALPAIPDRTFVDDRGWRWEWCGGQPGTWAWRVTSLLPCVQEQP